MNRYRLVGFLLLTLQSHRLTRFGGSVFVSFLRRMINPSIITGLMLFSGSVLSAAIDTYEFADETQHQRYRVMLDELRCPKCQNQNLASSDAPIAQDLRRELHRLIIEGENDRAIKAFMVERYGNFVLYRPPLDKNTLLLWSLPVILLAIGLLAASRIRQGTRNNLRGKLTDEELQQLAMLLKEYDQA